MLALIFAASIASAAPGGSSPPAQCAPPGPALVDNKGDAKLRKLGELPPAQHYLSLYRAIDRCTAPVIVRYGIGNSPRR